MTQSSAGGDTRNAPTTVQWPTDPTQNYRFWLSANLTGIYTTGFHDLDTVPLWGGIPARYGFTAESDTIRQFRLADGKNALAIYDSEVFTSVILIYPIAANQENGERRVRASTADHTLSAWLLRHPGAANFTHRLDKKTRNIWADDCNEFLATPEADRARQANAFELAGSAELEYGQKAPIIRRVIRGSIEFRSVKPLPRYVEFLDFKKALVNEDAKGDLPGGAAARKNQILSGYKAIRAKPSDRNAEIKGLLMGGWTRDLHLVFP